MIIGNFEEEAYGRLDGLAVIGVDILLLLLLLVLQLVLGRDCGESVTAFVLFVTI